MIASLASQERDQIWRPRSDVGLFGSTPVANSREEGVLVSIGLTPKITKKYPGVGHGLKNKKKACKKGERDNAKCDF